MGRKFLCLLLCLMCCVTAALAEEPADFFDQAEAESIGRFVRDYDSPTLKYTMEKFLMEGEICYLTRIWVQDPARQIRKATSKWKEDVKTADRLAAKVQGAALAINGSGFVSPLYPWIPENYPGTNEDYFYTPLGSLTVTDGEVFRNLEGVPFCGLALSEDGITLYRGADNDAVLASSPRQTWAFSENCAMMENGEDLLPEKGSWRMAKEQHPRTVLARVNRNNYLMLHVPNREDSWGLSLYRINLFFQKNFETEWVYNLDGGYSSALIIRDEKTSRLKKLAPNRQPVADILCITE